MIGPRQILVVMLLLASAPVYGQMYEYTDRNGNKVITDSPPPGVESREKKMNDERLFRSTRSESEYPSFDDKQGRGAEQKKKRYDRVTAVMYMTDW